MDPLAHLLRMRREVEVGDGAEGNEPDAGDGSGGHVEEATAASEGTLLAATNSSDSAGSAITKHGSELANKAKDFLSDELRKNNSKMLPLPSFSKHSEYSNPFPLPQLPTHTQMLFP